MDSSMMHVLFVPSNGGSIEHARNLALAPMVRIPGTLHFRGPGSLQLALSP